MNRRTTPPPLPPELTFFATPEHPCSYLPRQAITLFADPQAVLTTPLYGQLADYGFRRSGEYLYRPRCLGCHACQPARVSATRFQPNRSQRRTWQRNRDLQVRVCDAQFNAEHFDLYQCYVRSRHPGGGMDIDDPAQYRNFLCCRWSDTKFVEFRCADRLIAVAVVDRLPQGLSAVYTFYQPDDAERRSPGVYAVLWLLAEARRQGLYGVYLGYYISACQKMAYKANYRPLEVLIDGHWCDLETITT